MSACVHISHNNWLPVTQLLKPTCPWGCILTTCPFKNNFLSLGLVTGLGSGYGASVDWWSLGVLVHEMVTGVTPWRHTNIYTLYDMIIDQAFAWDSHHQSGYI